MLKILSLVMPVLLPSWRFFKSIEPSPRVEWLVYARDGVVLRDWAEFRPRRMTVSLHQVLGRLFWNAQWNDALFVMSCAERIVEQPTAHSIEEIKTRLLAELEQMPLLDSAEKVQFRLTFLSREAAGLSQEVLFISEQFNVAMAARL